LNEHEGSLKQIFIDALSDLQRATTILSSTLKIAARLQPREGNWIFSLSDEDLILLDALCVRFGRCQDLIGPCLRALAFLESSTPKSYEAILTTINEQGIISSLDNWRLQRALRNEGVHVYLTDSEILSEYYAAIIEHGPDVASYAERLRNYAQARFRVFEY
jgi:hypothetical protein